MYELNHVQASTFSYPILSPGAGGMKEQDLMCIKLHGVNRIGLKKIIDFIYTAKLSLNMENLQDTLEAASFLQILPVLDFCKVFLISGVRKHTTAAAHHCTVHGFPRVFTSCKFFKLKLWFILTISFPNYFGFKLL